MVSTTGRASSTTPAPPGPRCVFHGAQVARFFLVFFAAPHYVSIRPPYSELFYNFGAKFQVILDIEKPTIQAQWGDVGAGVVRKGDLKLHIGDVGQLIRPGDWSRPDSNVNVTHNEPTPYCTRDNMNTSTNCAVR